MYKVFLKRFFFLFLVISQIRGELIIIHCGVLIDGDSDKPQKVMSILIQEDKIIDVTEGYVNAGENDNLIDLNDFTVLPGLMICMCIFLENLILKNIWNASR